MFYAGVAQLVERNLAKVEVASSSLVSRSIQKFDAGWSSWQLVGLITRRSQVQVLPPLPFVVCEEAGDDPVGALSRAGTLNLHRLFMGLPIQRGNAETPRSSASDRVSPRSTIMGCWQNGYAPDS